VRRPVVLAVLAMLAGAALTSLGAVPAEPATADTLRAQLAAERRAGDRLENRLRREVRAARRETRAALAGRADPVREALTLAAVVYGLPRATASAVAWCESRHRPYARNGSSGASGLFQFLPSTWASTPFAGLSPFSPYANALAAGWLHSRSGWAPWACAP
jgi:soluble lytic murein transglycosylase-like protein